MIVLFGKLAAIAVATFALVSCGPIDACLDAGGQWDYERRDCLCERAELAQFDGATEAERLAQCEAHYGLDDPAD